MCTIVISTKRTDIPAANVKTHVSDLNAPLPPGTPIAVSDHCYACTAGSGFT